MTAVGAAGLHLRSAFVRNPQPAIARTSVSAFMLIDLGDWRHHDLLTRGVYQSHLTALLTRIASRGWTFLDVGSNIGYFSVLASALGGPTATVHAFEPHPRMASVAEINARMNPHISYEVFQVACSSGDGKALLYMASTPGNIGDSTLLAGTGEGRPTTNVTLVTLDDHCARRMLVPDIVKIDVEGSETGVIAGMSRLLSDRTPSHVVVELGDSDGRPPADEAIHQLAAFGYAPRSITAAGGLIGYAETAYLQDVCFIRA